jgi:hypothetical protein
MSFLWLLDHADREDIHKTTVFGAVEEGCVFLWVCFCIGGFDDDDRQGFGVVCVWVLASPPFPPPPWGRAKAWLVLVGLTTWLFVVGIACSFVWRVFARGAEAPLTGEFSAGEADHWVVYQVLVC